MEEILVEDLAKGTGKENDNLLPKFCPIDGSKMIIMDDDLVCEAENHAWSVKFAPGDGEFYSLWLTGS